MSWLLSTIDARVVEILESARGADGALGTGAQARSLAAGQFRRSAEAVPLTDAAYPRERADRAYDLAYQSWRDDPLPANPLDGAQVVRIAVDLRIGWVYGSATPAMAVAVSSETTTADVLAVRRRALSEAWRVVRALTFPDLVKDSGSPVAILTCQAAGPTTLDDPGRGYLLSVSPLEFWLEATTSAAFAPGS